MLLREHRDQRRGDRKKLQPLLREDVARPVMKPGLGAGFLLIGARLRQVPKVAVGHEANLVVIVKNHASMTGDAEILEQEIAREYIARRQIAQRVAVVQDGGFGRGRFGLPQK